MTSSITSPHSVPRKYHVGDVGREEDMVQHESFEETIVKVVQLRVGDHAFILRSEGYWTYARVSARSFGGTTSLFKFIVDQKSSTKVIKASQWTKFIRLEKHQDPSTLLVNQDFREVVVSDRSITGDNTNLENAMTAEDFDCCQSSSRSPAHHLDSGSRYTQSTKYDGVPTRRCNSFTTKHPTEKKEKSNGVQRCNSARSIKSCDLKFNQQAFLVALGSIKNRESERRTSSSRAA